MLSFCITQKGESFKMDLKCTMPEVALSEQEKGCTHLGPDHNDA